MAINKTEELHNSLGPRAGHPAVRKLRRRRADRGQSRAGQRLGPELRGRKRIPANHHRLFRRPMGDGRTARMD